MNIEIKTNSGKAWFLAARPKTLTGACIPVIISTALAYADDVFKWQPALLCLLFAGLMQIAANFINDLFDFLKGTDRSDRLGPERACAQGWITTEAMKTGIAVTLCTACAVGLLLLNWGSLWLIALGATCVVFAFLYTTLLSYLGLGDLLVLFSGLIIDLLLIINNYRDRDTDCKSGKRTLIALLGERFGNRQYLITGCLAWACCLWFVWHQHIWAFVLPTIFIPLHIKTWREMIRIHEGKALNGILGKTSRNMFLFALLVSVGLII